MRLKMNDDDDEDRDEWSNCLFDSWLQNKRAIVRPGAEDQNSQRLSSCQIVNNKLSKSTLWHGGGEGVRWEVEPATFSSEFNLRHMCPEAVFFVTKKSKETALGDLSRMSC